MSLGKWESGEEQSSGAKNRGVGESQMGLVTSPYCGTVEDPLRKEMLGYQV